MQLDQTVQIGVMLVASNLALSSDEEQGYIGLVRSCLFNTTPPDITQFPLRPQTQQSSKEVNRLQCVKLEFPLKESKANKVGNHFFKLWLCCSGFLSWCDFWFNVQLLMFHFIPKESALLFISNETALFPATKGMSVSCW